MGRRRSARTQGLPPSPSSNTPQIDLLTDNDVTLWSNNTSPSSNKASPTNTDIQSEIINNRTDGLLSFADYYDRSNEDNSSDNLLSLTNSHQSHSSWPHDPHATHSPNHHPNTAAENDTIQSLHQTIKLLTERLGRLESNTTTSYDNVTPTKPSPSSTPSIPSAPIQPNESNTIETTPARHQIDPPSMVAEFPTSLTQFATIASTTPSLTITQRVMAPDPPEDSYIPPFSSSIPIPTATVAMISSQSTSSMKQVPAMSTSLPTTPVYTIPPPLPTAPTPTIVYSKDTKLSFTTYKQSTDYSHWKALCLLEAQNNSKYTNITTKSFNKFVINPSMTDEESTALYLATMKALGSHAFNIISIEDTEEADGVQLWTSLDEYFDETEDSTLLKHDIKKAFENLFRDSNETVDNYRVRFEKHLHLLKLNKIMIPSHLELVFQFLNNMKVTKVFDDIIMQIDSGGCGKCD